MIKTAICVLLFTTCLFADNSSKWRGENGDGFATISVSDIPEWPIKGPNQIWRKPLGTGYSCLSIVDGVIYTLYGDNKYEYCVALHEKDGTEIWTRRIGYLFKNSHGDGPRSTPCVVDGKVYAISSYGEAYCFNAKNGKKIWGYNLIKKYGGRMLGWGTTTSPLVYKDKLFFNTGAKNGRSIVALSIENGELIWRSGDEETSYSTPIITNNDLPYGIFFTGSGITGIELENGNALWRYPWQTSSHVNAASPIFYNDHIYFSSSYGMGSAVIKVDPKNNYKIEEVWKNGKIKNHFSSSIFWKKHLYGFDDNFLVCVEFMTGKVLWKQRGFKKGTIVGINNGDAIVLGEGGNVALIELDEKQYIEKSSFDAFPLSLCRTIPTIVNDRLYLRNHEEIVCYHLLGKKSD